MNAEIRCACLGSGKAQSRDSGCVLRGAHPLLRGEAKVGGQLAMARRAQSRSSELPDGLGDDPAARPILLARDAICGSEIFPREGDGDAGE